MKRIAILLIMLFSLALGACASVPPEEPQESATFYGKILSIEGSNALAEALKSEAVRASSDQFSFSTAGLPDIGAVAGSYVSITFTGDIQESYPAGITVTGWALIPVQESEPNDVPAMTVSYGAQSTFLNYFPPVQWSQYDPGSGEVTTLLGCGFGPLDAKADPFALTRQGNEPIMLVSGRLPDTVTAIAWPAGILALSAEERQASYDTRITLETKGTSIQLPEDNQGYLVLATAYWNDKQDGKTPFGNTSYLLLIQPDAPTAQGD